MEDYAYEQQKKSGHIEISQKKTEKEINLSQRQFDVSELDIHLPQYSDEVIENTVDDIFNDVLNDTIWYGDSFDMKQIKEEIRNLRAVLSLGDKAEPEVLLNQYDRMIELTGQYLAQREGRNSRYANRHRKVRRLMEMLEGDRYLLVEKNNRLEKIAENRLHISTGEQLLADSDLKNDALKLSRSLFETMPDNEQDFLTKKQSILDNYNTLIERLRGKADSFCIFYSAKKKRLAAKRQLKQLEKEVQVISSYTFEKMRPDLNYHTWGEDYRHPVVEVDEGFFNKNPELMYSDTVTEDGYRILTNLLDARELFTFAEKKVSYEDVESYVMPEMKGLTIEGAIEKAKELNVPLMYSDRATEQLETIQLIDFIMGQKKRHDQSFEVKCSVQNIENVDYLVITDVVVRDHDACLGTDSPEEMNREEKGTSKRQIYIDFDKVDKQEREKLRDEYGREFNETGEQLLLNGYDHKVADRIIGLDEARLLKYFRSIGMEEEKVDAVSKRLRKMKELLEQDREKGFRKKFEDIKKEPEKYGSRVQERIKIEMRNMLVKGSRHTYINTSLIRDTGTKTSGDAMAVNSDEKEHVNSIKVVHKKFEKLREMIEADRKGISGTALRKETEEVTEAIGNYTKLIYDWQYLKGKKIQNHSGFSYLKKHEPERLEEFQGEDPKKLFFEKEGNAAQYYERLRSKRLKKAVEVIKQRIDILQKKKDKDDYETKEAERLNDYLKLLDHDMRGELVYDKKKAKRVKDTQFDKRYKFIDARDIELFPEEPMLSDVIQGNIGNCYLIAALGSVVESDPGFIKRHMKDNGDGTVTVRVYHGDTMSEKYDPIEVTVDKSVAYNEKGKPIGTQGALWVKLYEKAVAAAGIKQSSFSAYSLDRLDSGNFKEAFAIITGEKGMDLFSDEYGVRTDYSRIMPPDWKYKDKKTNKTGYTQKFYDRVAYVKSRLENLLTYNVAIVAETYSKLAGTPGEGVNGEEVRRGIASNHGYTVIGMEEIEGKSYVRIRNPWGSGVVETLQNELTGKTFIKEGDLETAQGSFLIDINTFVEHFVTITFVGMGEAQNEEEHK